MTDVDVIGKILKASKPSDLFNGDEPKKIYIQYSKLIHPDVCSNKSAGEAMAKMNYFKDVIENGTPYVDETGPFRVFEKKIVYEVNDANRKLLTKSVSNYNQLMSKHDNASVHFHKYLPQSMTLEKDRLTIILADRSVPLTGQKLEQKHINWLFSRMFEFTLWLRQIEYVHLGLNPTTVFVVPETHGIIIISFYHMTVLGKKAETISAKYKMWYPTTLFTKKVATPDIDLELCKKIALYLLGDRSAAGTKLKKDKEVNQEVLTFLLTKHKNEKDEFVQYRELLKKNFESKFYPLSL
jgi:hypothetical protein